MAKYDTLILLLNKKSMMWGVGHRLKSLMPHLKKAFPKVRYALTKADLPPCNPEKTIVHFLSVGSRHYIQTQHKDDWKKVRGMCWGIELTSKELSRKWLFKAKMMRGATYAIAKNPDLKDEADQQNMGVKCTYIPNGVEPAMFIPRFRVGWVGHTASPKNIMKDHKGLLLIKQAIRELNKEYKGLAVFVFAPSPTVWPTKVLTPRQVANHMSTLDVYINASISEGCSNTVMEALSLGLPLVTTRSGIWRELDQKGLVVVEDRTVEGLKHGLTKAVKPRLKISKTMREDYSWNSVASQYVKLFKGLGLEGR